MGKNHRSGMALSRSRRVYPRRGMGKEMEMPIDACIADFECTSCFARSPATAASFVPSPTFNARLSNTDSAVPHDLHEA